MTDCYILSVTEDDLKYYSPEEKQWKADRGSYTIYIGSSSADIRAKSKIIIRK